MLSTAHRLFTLACFPNLILSPRFLIFFWPLVSDAVIVPTNFVILVVVGVVICAAVGSAAPLTWTKIVPATVILPPARGASAIGFDAVRHRLILFGGKNGGAIYDDTWQFNLTDYTWTQLFPTTKPEPRFSVVFGTDHRHGRLVVATGEGSSASVFFNDVWAFDFVSNNWFESTPLTGGSSYNGEPAIRYGAAGGISPHSTSNGTILVSHGFYGETRLKDTYGVEAAASVGTAGQYAEAGPTYERRAMIACCPLLCVRPNSFLRVFCGADPDPSHLLDVWWRVLRSERLALNN